MFRKNDLELGIFNRRGPIFFSPKVFSRPLRLIERKKNRKKNSFQNVVGSPWIYPKLTQPLFEISTLTTDHTSP